MLSAERFFGQALGEGSLVLVEVCCIVPEWGVACMLHQVDLCVRNRSLVPIYSRWLDHRISSAMCNQDRRRDRRQDVVVVQGARQQALTHMGWNRDVIPQHQKPILDRRLMARERRSRMAIVTTYTPTMTAGMTTNRRWGARYHAVNAAALLDLRSSV